MGSSKSSPTGIACSSGCSRIALRKEAASGDSRTGLVASRVLALGAFPEVSLDQARTLAANARAILRDGTDPSLVRKQAKLAAVCGYRTFRAVAEEYLEKKVREGRTGSTLIKLRWLLGFAYPILGDRDVAKIRPIDILPVLKAVEIRRRIETARRLREIIGSVFRYAMATARTESDPTVALRGALAEYRPKPRAAITSPKEFGALLRAIDGFEGQPTTAAALKLMPLLFVRPGEMRCAEWSEIDLEKSCLDNPRSPHEGEEQWTSSSAAVAASVGDNQKPQTDHWQRTAPVSVSPHDEKPYFRNDNECRPAQDGLWPRRGHRARVQSHRFNSAQREWTLERRRN